MLITEKRVNGILKRVIIFLHVDTVTETKLD